MHINLPQPVRPLLCHKVPPGSHWRMTSQRSRALLSISRIESTSPPTPFRLPSFTIVNGLFEIRPLKSGDVELKTIFLKAEGNV